MRDVWVQFFLGLVPPGALVLAALGSIVFGLATPTEGAACGALGSLVLAAAYGRLTRRNLHDALVKTLEISVLILFLVAASNFFGAVFARLGTPTMLTDALLAMDLNPYLTLFIIMALIFLPGWPLEWVPIVLIVVPFLLPLVDKLGFDKAWASTSSPAPRRSRSSPTIRPMRRSWPRTSSARPSTAMSRPRGSSPPRARSPGR